jgi:hypothetical protein
VLSSDEKPETVAPVESLSVKFTEDAVTAWLKVAVGVTLTATPVAPVAGAVEVTAGAGGGAAVVKLHEYGDIVWPVLFVAPLTVAV